jgi:ESX secretion system protein EccA
VGSDTLAAADMATPRVDRDVVSRFATCCRALGLAVHDRQRPADWPPRAPDSQQRGLGVSVPA